MTFLFTTETRRHTPEDRFSTTSDRKGPVMALVDRNMPILKIDFAEGLSKYDVVGRC
jgi:hypothetical protein